MTLGELEIVLFQRDLLLTVADSKNENNEATEIKYLTCDSRRVVPGTLFICKGAAFREEYLEEAARRGAVAYISEKPLRGGAGMTGYLVNNIRKTMAAVSAVFFRYYPGRIRITGITGTKGKTTTAWYLKAMLDTWQHLQGKKKTGLISTVQNYDGNRVTDAVVTTPEAPALHELVAEAEKNDLEYLTMEVSSQALKYRRVQEIIFEVGVFLNISEDHISPIEHSDFEDYFSAKLSMFRQCRTAVVNLDADHAERILQAARKAGRIVTFGRHPQADFRISEISTKNGFLAFRVTGDRFSETFRLKMRGKFNIENAVAAIAAASAYGVPVECMKAALSSVTVPGRMETYCSRDGRICGIVDFAHNRLSFEKLYDAVFHEFGEYRRIITVFGCPGGKGLNRRRELGLISGLFSDEVIVTTDDPGSEEPDQIAEEIRRYVEVTGCGCRCIRDRKAAIAGAVSLADKYTDRTLILFLGRGNEKYQRIGGKLLPHPADGELMAEALQLH